MQTRHHIFTQCGVLETQDWDPRFILELVSFLVDNPIAFVFGFQYAPPQEGDG
jgi:hypothetical protein